MSVLVSSHRWHLDPSGTYTLYEAKAIGSGSEGAQTSLQEIFHKVCTGASGLCVSQILYIALNIQDS